MASASTSAVGTTVTTSTVDPSSPMVSSATLSSPTTPIPISSRQFSLENSPPGFRPPSSAIHTYFPASQPSVPTSLFPSSYYEIGAPSSSDVLSNTTAQPNIYGGLPPSPAVINVTNYVTIKLTAVEDFLPWKALFTGFLISQQLSGFVDGSTPMPTAQFIDSSGQQRINPEYMAWIRCDQAIRTWLFATLSREVLLEVYDLPHSKQIWDRLESRFNTATLARSIELKRQLTTLSKPESKSMEEFLQEVKMIADSLKAIKTPVSDLELIHYVVYALGPAYDTLITTLTNMPGQLSFEELRTRLIIYEQRHKFMLERDSTLPSHQAFATHNVSDGRHGVDSRSNMGTINSNSNRSNNGGGRFSRGGRGRYRGGRGRMNSGGQYNENRNHINSNPRSLPTSSANGTPSPDGLLGPHPSHVVCQTCFSPGHRSDVCPTRCTHYPSPKASAASMPAYSTFGVGETNEQLWYPDTAAASHMTPHEGLHHGGGSSSCT